MELSGQPPTSDMDDTTHILTETPPRNGEAGRLLAAPTLLDGRLVCNQCGQIMRAKRMCDEFKSMTGESGERLYEMQTLVGYCSPSGHNHDDNCWTREYLCPNGHTMKIGKRRRCPACDWVGKESCGCHDCLKVDEFPKPSNTRISNSDDTPKSS